MKDQFAQREMPRRLSDLLDDLPAWSLAERWGMFRGVVEQVYLHHRDGRIHRRISPEAVSIDAEHRAHLEPPPASCRFCRDDYDPQSCPPELAEAESLDLPVQLEAARQVLQDCGFALDPRRVDLYQLGALWSQWLTGETFLAYLYDPLVKGRIPPAARLVIERALGEGNARPLESCEELLALIDQAIAEERAKSSIATGQETPAQGSIISADTQAVGGTAAGPVDVDGPLPFERLGRFRIVRRIGRGGMGDVYEGFDESLQRAVAVKVLPPELARDREFVERFRTEAAAAGQLSHPNVVPIYTIGEEAGRHFFAMQFVEGESLADRLARCRRLSPGETLEIVRQCLSGLQAAHQRGLIHRDVKPGNVLLDRRTGLAMLVDFGLVRVVDASQRMTATGTIMGTVDYMAPEQALGKPVDERSDLYALGIVAYELLAGRLPFEADSATAMIFQHAYADPYPLWQAAPDAPRALVDIVTRMMARRPEDRYGSAQQALADIQAYEAGQPLAAATSAGHAAAGIEGANLASLPELPPETTRWLQPNWRQALWARTMSLFRARAPQFLRELQTTEQQVDGAVAEYQRRHDKLARLVEEAEGIAGDLAARKQSYLGAIQQAEQRIREATSATSSEAARRDWEHCRQAAAEVEQQQRKYEEDLEDLRLGKAKLHARLLQLVHQRDLLEARWKMARARLARPDTRAARRRLVWVAAISTALVLALAVRYWAMGILHPAPARHEVVETPVPKAPPSPPPVVSEDIEPPVATSGKPSRAKSGSSPRGYRGALPPYTLKLASKQTAEFQLQGMSHDWLAKSFTAEILVSFEYLLPKPVRIMGNLDPMPSGSPKGGWALLLLPPDNVGAPGDAPTNEKKDSRNRVSSVWWAWQKNLAPNKSKWRHLALVYTAPDGSVRRLIGAPFEPGDLWWSIAVSRIRDGKIMVVLSRVSYMDERVDDMLVDPSSNQFWLGSPSAAAEDFGGQIGGFSLHEAAYADVVRDPSAAARVSLDFSAPPTDNFALDASGWGNHGRIPDQVWQVWPERMPRRSSSQWAPKAGKAFVAEFGEGLSIELLGTRGLAGLDRTFTAEFWMRTNLPGEQTLVGDMIQETFPGAGTQLAGWSLVLARPSPKSGRLAIEFPGGSQSAARITSAEIPLDDGWHHVALCVTPTRRQIYWDGKPAIADPAQQSDAIRTHWSPSPANLMLGKRGTINREVGRKETLLLRAFRLSSTLRYQKEFKPPPTFERDEHTQVLLDFSHNGGKFIPNTCDEKRSGLVAPAQWREVDKTW